MNSSQINLDEQFADFASGLGKMNTGNDELDAYYERQQQVKYHLMEVQNFAWGETPLMLDRLVTVAKKDLKKIDKKEERINAQKSEQLDEIKRVNTESARLQTELNRLNHGNQQMIEEIDGIEKKIQVASEEMEQQMDDQVEKNKVSAVREQIQELKTEMNQMNVREGFIRTKLEQEKLKGAKDPSGKSSVVEIDEDF